MQTLIRRDFKDMIFAMIDKSPNGVLSAEDGVILKRAVERAAGLHSGALDEPGKDREVFLATAIKLVNERHLSSTKIKSVLPSKAPATFRYKYKKKMSLLDDENFKTMRKDNLKALLAVSNPGRRHGSYPTPDQRIGVSFRGLSDATRDELIHYVKKGRDAQLRNKKPFQVFYRDATKHGWIPHPDPVVEWGNHTGYVAPKNFQVGDIIEEIGYSWESPLVYRVIGYTKTGRPRLRLLPLIKVSSDENERNEYRKQTTMTKKYMPDVASTGTARAFKTATSYKKWNGNPVESTLNYGR